MESGWLFTNILAVTGVVYGWMNPYYGLMVYYCFSILRPTMLWFWSDWPTERYSFYLALTVLIGWVFKGFGEWSGLRGVWLPVFGLALYLFAGVFTWRFTAISAPRAWHFLYPQLTVGIMILATISLVRSEKEIRTFAWVILLSLGYLAWVFNSQYYFDGWNRVYWNGFGGIDNNGVAMIMVTGIAPAFFLGVLAKRQWVRGLCFFMALLLMHVILFSFSRGGQLGLAIVFFGIIFIALFQLPRKGLTLLLAGMFAILAFNFAGAEVRDEFWSIFVDAEDRDASAASRFDTWSAAWRCMKDHPMGVGARNFNLISQYYGLSRNKSVHNLFLQTGADYGFAGMFGLIIFYLGSIINAYFMTRTATAKKLVWPRYYGHVTCLSLGGLLVCSTFIGMESVEVGYLIAMLGMCTTAYVYRIEASHKVELPGQLPEMEQVSLPDPYGEVTTA